MELSELFHQLTFSLNDGLTGEALDEAVSRKDEITPRLIEILAKCADRFPERDPEWMEPIEINAMYLLAQFREPRAYAPLVAIVSRMGPKSDFMGDIVTEDLGRILASVYDGDIEPLLTLVLDENVEEFARGACIEAMENLVRASIVSREEVIRHLAGLYKRLERRPNNVWNCLVETTTQLYPEELLPELRRVIDEDLDDPFLRDESWIEERIGTGKEAALQEFYSNRGRKAPLINDIRTDMRWWTELNDLDDEIFGQWPEGQQASPTPEYPDRSPEFYQEAPILRSPGRNDPCSCGSGKKFKKCCGRNLA